MVRMPIQQHHIEDLKRIYRKHFARNLSDQDAWAMAHRFLNLYRVLIRQEQSRQKRLQFPRRQP
jgi:hypothetical protein